MKKYIKIFALIFTINCNSQDNNQLLVDYTYENDYFKNREVLIVKDNNTFYINDTLNIKNNAEPIKDEDGNYTISPNKINLKKKSIYGNLNNNIFNIIMPYKNKTFFVSDTLNHLKWEIQDAEKLKIGEYNCTKALLTFRGRDYKAYFTEEIPISTGPWKFKSLPGLILYIESTSGELTHSWKANKIIYPFNKNTNQIINFEFDEKIISLKEYITYKEKEFLINSKISDSRVPKGTSVQSTKVERLGIELIYEWEEN